jgi:hypothetical protein
MTWMMKTRLTWVLSGLGLGAAAFGPGTAAAHLMPPGHGTLNVVDGKAYMVLSVPVSAFSDVEACRDGILTPAELSAHHDALVAQVRADVHLAHAGAFEQVLFDLPSGYGHEHDAGEDLVVMVVAPVPDLSAGLSLQTDLWTESSDRLKVRATVSEGGRDVRTEVAVLTTDRRSSAFFDSAPSVVAARLGSRGSEGR